MFIKCTIFSGFLLLFSAGALAEPLFADNKQTPVQVFEQAQSGGNVILSSTSKSHAPSPHKLPVVSKLNLEDKSAANVNSEPAASTNQLAGASGNQAAPRLLQDDIDSINRTTIIYRQSVDKRIETLNAQVELTDLRLKKLEQAMLLLNQQVAALSNKSNATSISDSHITKQQGAHFSTVRNKAVSWFHALQLHLGFYGVYTLLILVLLALIIAVWAFLPKSKKHTITSAYEDVAPMPTEAGEDDTQNEYDYMGSNESTPAKLNLARAYIAMDDYKAALKVIQEVLSSGNASQCDDARELLDKISQAKS